MGYVNNAQLAAILKEAMNSKQLVKLSNIIGVISIILLIYWVFTFIVIEVFGLKIFREILSESFFMSILGILALMTGALMINVMFNLTRIAQKHNHDSSSTNSNRKTGWALVLGFPLLLILLFIGDYLTSEKKEKLLVSSAQSIIEMNDKKSNHLVSYSFSREWIVETESILNILSKTDENFPHVSIIVLDTLDEESIFLGFNEGYYGNINDSIPPRKKNYIRMTTQKEREYLYSVFENNNDDYRYSANDGNYELFYPFVRGDKKIVIYFAEYQRYGKIGS